jgi:putative ABC transport system ATP-binding protein
MVGHDRAKIAEVVRPVIEVKNLSKLFGRNDTAVHAVNDVTFTLPPRTFTAITGPSGSGKSTVLHLIAGLTPPSDGSIMIEGVDVTSATREESAQMRLRDVAYVMQHFSLLPFLSAFDNAAMPLRLDDVNEGEIEERVLEVLRLVDMQHRARHRPSELSGGEQQRIAIARALAINPRVLLADEPTGNLDQAAGVSVMDLLQDVNEQTGVTVLLVTHDPKFAARADRVIRLVDGRIDQDMDLSSDVSIDDLS